MINWSEIKCCLESSPTETFSSEALQLTMSISALVSFKRILTLSHLSTEIEGDFSLIITVIFLLFMIYTPDTQPLTVKVTFSHLLNWTDFDLESTFIWQLLQFSINTPCFI